MVQWRRLSPEFLRQLDKIAGDVKTLITRPEMRERFTALGVEAEGTSPSEFKNYFRNDVEKGRKVVGAARVSTDRGARELH